MHSDCFVRGVHSICQDYAIVNDHSAYLSDGCSSSPKSEVGAHVLPALAEKDGLYLLIHIRDLKLLESGLCFDTTLMGMSRYQAGDLIDVSIIGDGIIIARKKSGPIETYTIEYAQNAPFYVSYAMDEKRKEMWENQYPNNTKIVMEEIWYPDNGYTMNRNRDELIDIYHRTFDMMLYDSLFIASDGLKSFKDNTAKEIPLKAVVDEILAIKNYNGAFLQRRMTKMMKDFHEEGITAYDDISVAGFYWGDEK